MSRKLTIIVFVLFLLGGSAAISYFFLGLKESPSKKAITERKRFVKAIPVDYSVVRSEIIVSGRLLSSQSFDLAAEVQGKILEGAVPLKKGQTFVKNQVLFSIYNKDIVQSLHAKKSRFLTSLANSLPDFRMDFPERFEVWSEFFNQLDIKKTLPPLPEISDRQEKIFLASRNILSDYYSIIGDEIHLEKYEVRAPFQGSFTEVYLEVGAVANPGSRIAAIIRTDAYELEVPVDVQNIDAVSIGENVVVSNENATAKWDAKIVRIGNFIDVATQSVPVFVTVEQNAAFPLYEGQYLKAFFPGKSLDESMEIPRKAVFNHDEVFVVEDGRLTKKTIQVLQVNDETVIFSGLQEGVFVVVEPMVSASEGIAVDII